MSAILSPKMRCYVVSSFQHLGTVFEHGHPNCVAASEFIIK